MNKAGVKIRWRSESGSLPAFTKYKTKIWAATPTATLRRTRTPITKQFYDASSKSHTPQRGVGPYRQGHTISARPMAAGITDHIWTVGELLP
jgi:hypothetical protein